MKPVSDAGSKLPRLGKEPKRRRATIAAPITDLEASVAAPIEDAPCPERAQLFERYSSAVGDYYAAVQALFARRTKDQESFDREEIEVLWIRCELARRDVEAHSRQHGCVESPTSS